MKYFAFIVLIVFISCKGDKTERNRQVVPGEIIDNIVNQKDTTGKDKTEIDKVICSDTLSTSIMDFTNKIDSIPNPFKRSTCYSLGFFKEGKDSMLALEAYVYFPRLTEQMKSYYEGKGMFYLNDKKVAIFDWKESLGGQFYNEDKLEPIPPFEEDSISKKWAGAVHGKRKL